VMVCLFIGRLKWRDSMSTRLLNGYRLGCRMWAGSALTRSRLGRFDIVVKLSISRLCG